jgi:hypothetical protein
MPRSMPSLDAARAFCERRPTVTMLLAIAVGLVAGWLSARAFDRTFLGSGIGAVCGIAVGAALSRKSERKSLREIEDKLDALRTYTDGKMQRYTLLFAVNGGAFAVGQYVLGSGASTMKAVLPIGYLADGAIIFTALMTVDIWLYGQMMRREFVGPSAFTPAGKAILLLISALLIAGWLLVPRNG